MIDTGSKKKDSILIIGTHADDDIEKAMLIFMAATAAQAIDIKVNVFLVSHGTNLARKGYAETMPRMSGMESIETLIKNHIEMGGGLYVCIPCKEARGVKNSQYLSDVKFSNMMDMMEMVQRSEKVLVF